MATREIREKSLATIKEAEKLLKKGKKLCSPSLFDFRLKADWEAAAPLFEKAALLFKQNNVVPQAIEAYERAATAQEKLGSPWHAAKHMEVCGELSKGQPDAKEAISRYYRDACAYYSQAGKNLSGADAVARGARALEALDVEEALRLYYEAIDLYELEQREAQASDIFRLAISMLVKAQRWADAVEMQLRFGSACDRNGARNSQLKAYLGSVVTWLYARDGTQAWQTFQDVMAIDAFSNSDEAFAADALFQAYRNGSEEDVKQVIASRGCFRNLDNQVGRLAQRLPVKGMAKVARELAKVMGPGSEEEAEQEEEEEGGDDDVL